MKNTKVKYTYTKKCTDLVDLSDWIENTDVSKIDIEKIAHYTPRDIRIEFFYCGEKWSGDFDGNKWYYMPSLANPINLSKDEKIQFDKIFSEMIKFISEKFSFEDIYA